MRPRVPEGHVIHRLAGELTAHFGGHGIRSQSPQGRFAAQAQLLDGMTLEGAVAYGKHLLVEVGPHRVHIHLGMAGRFTIQTSPATGPLTSVRWQLLSETALAQLRGPAICELLDDNGIAALFARLGPDPLRADANPAVAWQRISRSGQPIAALLMDQRIFAGVGNIYRAEVLFRQRLDPMTPGNALRRNEFTAMWDDLVTLMAAGVATGRIDTVRPEHLPEAMGRPPRVDRHGGEVYLYRRASQPCLICHTPVRSAVLAGRNLFWCPRCQRRGRSRMASRIS